MLIGDFNEVLHRGEHMGVKDWSNSQIEAFRDMFDTCELMDLGYAGTPWMFEKKVAGGSSVECDWCERFPLANLQHLTTAVSDHSPIFLLHEPRPEHQPSPKHVQV
jgi:hypothetical protein